MKTNIIILSCALVLSGGTMAYVGCTTTSQVQAGQTLQAVGLAVDAAMKTAAGMYHNNQITAAQWAQIADIHDNKFQPAFNLAVQAVQANLSSIASPDVVALASQLSALVASFQPKTT
jgi:hypothetical protein